MFGENGAGGQWTLKYTFNAMSFAASVDVIAFTTRYVFSILLIFYMCIQHLSYHINHFINHYRSILLTLNDFDFALKATLISAVVYIPAIIVATMGGQEFVDQSITLFIVMYLPQFVISVLFFGRIVQILNKMKNGESGTWEMETMYKHEETGFSLTKSYKLA